MGFSEGNVWVPVRSAERFSCFSQMAAQLSGWVYRSLMKPFESGCQEWNAPDWSSLLWRRERPPAECDSFPILKATL